MIRKRFFAAPMLAAAMLLASSLTPIIERAEAATKIEVVVNKSVITSYEIDKRARLLRLVKRSLGAAAARGQARQELVEEALKLDEAKRLGIGITKSQVDAAYASIAQRSKLSPKQLSAALRRSGVDPEELKRRILAQMAWGRIVRMRFQATVKVEDQDVIAALRDKKEEGEFSDQTTEYTLAQIIFVVPSKMKATMEGYQRRAAEKLRREFSSCDTDLEKARALKEVVVKKIGIRNEADINEESRKRLKGVEIGHLTEFRRDNLGYEALAVCDKKVLDSDAAALSILKDEMKAEEGERLSRRFLMELRRNANIQYR